MATIRVEEIKSFNEGNIMRGSLLVMPPTVLVAIYFHAGILYRDYSLAGREAGSILLKASSIPSLCVAILDDACVIVWV